MYPLIGYDLAEAWELSPETYQPSLLTMNKHHPNTAISQQRQRPQY